MKDLFFRFARCYSRVRRYGAKGDGRKISEENKGNSVAAQENRLHHDDGGPKAAASFTLEVYALSSERALADTADRIRGIIPAWVQKGRRGRKGYD